MFILYAIIDELLSSSGLAKGPATFKKESAEDNGLLCLYSFTSHQSPSSPAPCGFVPKGVLKHTKSTDSESSTSMETETKKVRLWSFVWCPLWPNVRMSCSCRVYYAGFIIYIIYFENVIL